MDEGDVTSKALVTTSDALVTSSVALVSNSFLLLVVAAAATVVIVAVVALVVIVIVLVQVVVGGGVGVVAAARSRIMRCLLRRLLAQKDCQRESCKTGSIVAKGIATTSKDATRGSWPYY